jgi:hypothetical protein
MERWEAAVEEFLKEWRKHEYVVGALACGSYVTGDPSKRSDIDLHVVLSEETDWRERGNRVIDGFLIEYFANPPGQIREYFRSDYSDNCCDAATQFATGRIIFDDTSTIAVLKAEGREWLAKAFERPDSRATELMLYALWDEMDNLRDSYERKAPDNIHLYHHTLRRIYERYARFIGQPVVSASKQHLCLYNPDAARRKYLLDEFPDRQFLALFLKALSVTDTPDSIEELKEYVTEQMGGIQVDGWQFRSERGDKG